MSNDNDIKLKCLNKLFKHVLRPQNIKNQRLVYDFDSNLYLDSFFIIIFKYKEMSHSKNSHQKYGFYCPELKMFYYVSDENTYRQMM